MSLKISEPITDLIMRERHLRLTIQLLEDLEDLPVAMSLWTKYLLRESGKRELYKAERSYEMTYERVSETFAK
jgi:hypothetical protein